MFNLRLKNLKLIAYEKILITGRGDNVMPGRHGDELFHPRNHLGLYSVCVRVNHDIPLN